MSESDPWTPVILVDCVNFASLDLLHDPMETKGPHYGKPRGLEQAAT